MVEHLSSEQKVAGSSPVLSIFAPIIKTAYLPSWWSDQTTIVEPSKAKTITEIQGASSITHNKK